MHRLLAACLLLPLGLPPAARAQSNESATVNLTVSAASSLQDALELILPAFAMHEPRVTVTVRFGGSGELGREIEHGAPVDVFFSDGLKPMDALDRQGLLLSDTRRNVLANHLVLIVPQTFMDVRTFADLTKPAVKHVAMGDPRSEPIGQYTEQSLEAFGLFDKLKPKLVDTGDSRRALAMVETGAAQAGFAYYTEARASPQAKMIVAVPDSLHSPIVYPVAVIKSSIHPEQAKEFEAFLDSPDAQEIFLGLRFPVLNH